MPDRFRAALACRIVALDRVQFNDAVASGNYPCAPSTLKGSARIFTEGQLLPLFFFARLSEFGIPARRAGFLACEMASVASADYAEPADRIVFVQCTSGNFFVPSKIKVPATGDVEPNYNPEHETTLTKKYPQGMYYPATGRVIFTIEFYIRHVREIIAARVADEVSILGEEEE